MSAVVIGKTLADAQAYKDKYGLTEALLVSPASFHARYNKLANKVERFYVTREAFTHPNANKVVATVQTYMRHHMDS